MSNLQSSGRGGAGNIIDASKAPKPQPADLQTPTLKSSVVTTGRGGTGNFASGLDEEEKRRRQDVEPVVRTDNTGATYIGRGGTGNLVKPVIPGVDPEDGAALAKAQSAVSTSSTKSDDKDAKSPSPAAGDADDKRRRSSDAKNGPGLVEKGLNKLFGKK